jgi:uncharacterized protein
LALLIIPLENSPNRSDNNLMNCPRCKKPMVILEFEKVEVDYCAACQGVWLDSGELELLLDASKDIPLHADQASRERLLKCPRCSGKMEKVRSETDNSILLDRCRKGHGLWFDGGELEALLRGQKTGPHSRISEHLRGIFMKHIKSLDTGEAK